MTSTLDTKRETVGVIGTGEIGHALAVSALRAGYAVVAHDHSPAAAADLSPLGATLAADVREVASRATLIQIAVMDDAQVCAATTGDEGVLGVVQPDTVLIVHSTIHPRTVREVGAAAAAAGAAVVDAPVTDPFGVRGIETRTACFLVGGEERAVARVWPLLQRSAGRIFHLGGVGAGMSAKLVRNLTMYVSLVAAFEAKRMAGAIGLDRQTLREILSASGASSRAMDNYLSRTSYDDGYRDRLPTLIEIFGKDMRLAIDFGKELGLSLPGAELTREAIAGMLAPEGS